MRKRILIFIGSFLVIYVFNFFLPRLMPGSPFLYASSVSGEDSTVELSAEQIEMMEAYYGLDKPLWEQFTDTVSRNLRGDLGQSIHYKRPVAEILGERLPWSLLLMGSSLLLSLVIGTGLALLSVRSRRWDRVWYPVQSVLAEIPPFLLGLLLLFFLAAQVGWLPLSGGATPFARYDSWLQQAGDVALHALLPVLALTLVTVPSFYFTARAGFLEILRRPYLLTARAKGLKEGRIRRRYILRNGAAPIVARLFLSVGAAVGGTLLVENVFAYPGLGTVMREAVRYRDYVMIQGVFLLSAAVVLVSLLLADLVNAWMDRGEGCL